MSASFSETMLGSPLGLALLGDVEVDDEGALDEEDEDDESEEADESEEDDEEEGIGGNGEGKRGKTLETTDSIAPNIKLNRLRLRES